MFYRIAAIAAAAIALQGCATKGPATAVATENLNEGIAKSCTASPLDPASANATATIAMSNDGWCAVRTTERDGQPFQLGLVRQRPEHGQVLIQKIGGQTRIEYTAERGFVGADRFSVALRPRASGAPDATVQVAVNVTMGEGMAAAPAPEAAPAPAATRPRTTSRTPARRSTR